MDTEDREYRVGYFREKNNRDVLVSQHMNDEDFAQLVALEVKKRANPEGVKHLHREENLVRWQKALSSLLTNLTRQVERFDDQIQECVDRYSPLGREGMLHIEEVTKNLEDKKRKVISFRFHVEKRYDEVSKMVLINTGEASPDGSIVDFYRRAIERHRELMREYEFEPTRLDEALWAALDGKWEFDDAREDMDDEDEFIGNGN